MSQYIVMVGLYRVPSTIEYKAKVSNMERKLFNIWAILLIRDESPVDVVRKRWNRRKH